MLNEKKKINAKLLACAGLIFVMLVWGASPLLNTYLYAENSATVCSSIISLFATLAMLVVCIPHFNKFDKSILKIAIPTGIFNSVASILQKIGLQYTTPTNYAFLENLSCVVVPILLIILIRKKPHYLTIIASVLCLASSFVLTGMLGGAISLNVGDILCALAGVFYGVNIAVTGIYAKKIFAPFYVFIQMCVQTILSIVTAVALNFICIGGKPIEVAKFAFKIEYILIIIFSGVFINAMCWLIRTNVMKNVDATVVAVIMPFSAVVTGILSVIIGTDAFTITLVIGAVLGVIAGILSGLADAQEGKAQDKSKESEKKNKRNKINKIKTRG